MLYMKTKNEVIPTEYLNGLKVIFYKSEANILNYGQLLNIEDEIIETTNVKIIGDNLKIKKLTKFEIKLIGNIKRVERVIDETN